jgi:hypothetical protein
VMGSFILRTPFNRSVSLAGSEKIAVHSLCAKENRKGQKRRTQSHAILHNEATIHLLPHPVEENY